MSAKVISSWRAADPANGYWLRKGSWLAYVGISNTAMCKTDGRARPTTTTTRMNFLKGIRVGKVESCLPRIRGAGILTANESLGTKDVDSETGA